MTTTIASLVPGLAQSYADRALLARVIHRLSTRGEWTLPAMIADLRALVGSDDAVLRVVSADGRWTEWTRAHLATEGEEGDRP